MTLKLEPIAWLGEGENQKVQSFKGCLPLKVFFHQMSSSIKGRPPSKGVFRQRSSSIKGCLPSKCVYNQRSSSIEGYLPLEVVSHWRLSSIKGCLPSMVVFHQRLSSIKRCLSFFHWKLSSIKGSFSWKVVFHWRSFSIKVHLPSLTKNWDWSQFCFQSEFAVLKLVLILSEGNPDSLNHPGPNLVKFLDPLYQTKSCHWSLNFKVLFSNLDSWLELLNLPIGSGLVWKKSLGNKFIINWCPWD